LKYIEERGMITKEWKNRGPFIKGHCSDSEGLLESEGIWVH
jgi:hypothetical protein